MRCKFLTVRIIMAEEFEGTGIWKMGDGKGGGLGRDERAQTGGEKAGNGGKGGGKGICDLSRKMLELKSEDSTT